MRMRALDLFSGIGGLSLALKDYTQTVAYCEIDPYAQAVLLDRMKSDDLDTAPVYVDVREVRRTTLRSDGIDNIDIIIGGFPCQDISVAGAGRGLAGERSGLFFEIVRLAKEIQPTFLFLENVPAIRTRGLDRVIQELTQAGYDCRWGMLSASDVGAPHKRERWFCLARRRLSNPDQQYDESNAGSVVKASRKTGKQERRNGSDSMGSEVSDTLFEGLEIKQENQQRTNEIPAFTSCGWWAVEPNVDRVVNGLPFRVDRIKCLGNAVVPQQAKEAFERLIGLREWRPNG